MRTDLPRRISRCKAGAVLVAVLSVILATSCSRSSHLPLHPVQGTVMVRNKPGAGAVVVLRPVVPGPLTDHLPHGNVEPDGTFRIGTFGKDDGAPAGEYKVTIVWPQSRRDPLTGDDVTEDRLRGRYSDPATTPLQATIKQGENVLPPFRLH